jgi:hypothetical protein
MGRAFTAAADRILDQTAPPAPYRNDYRKLLSYSNGPRAILEQSSRLGRKSSFFHSERQSAIPNASPRGCLSSTVAIPHYDNRMKAPHRAMQRIRSEHEKSHSRRRNRYDKQDVSLNH